MQYPNWQFYQNLLSIYCLKQTVTHRPGIQSDYGHRQPIHKKFQLLIIAYNHLKYPPMILGFLHLFGEHLSNENRYILINPQKAMKLIVRQIIRLKLLLYRHPQSLHRKLKFLQQIQHYMQYKQCQVQQDAIPKKYPHYHHHYQSQHLFLPQYILEKQVVTPIQIQQKYLILYHITAYLILQIIPSLPFLQNNLTRHLVYHSFLRACHTTY